MRGPRVFDDSHPADTLGRCVLEQPDVPPRPTSAVEIFRCFRRVLSDVRRDRPIGQRTIETVATDDRLNVERAPQRRILVVVSPGTSGASNETRRAAARTAAARCASDISAGGHGNSSNSLTPSRPMIAWKCTAPADPRP